MKCPVCLGDLKSEEIDWQIINSGKIVKALRLKCDNCGYSNIRVIA